MFDQCLYNILASTSLQNSRCAIYGMTTNYVSEGKDGLVAVIVPDYAPCPFLCPFVKLRCQWSE